jgi:hypothetical protein
LHPKLFGGTVSKCNVPISERKMLLQSGGSIRTIPSCLTQPVVFSQADPRALYYANQFLL